MVFISIQVMRNKTPAIRKPFLWRTTNAPACCAFSFTVLAAFPVFGRRPGRYFRQSDRRVWRRHTAFDGLLLLPAGKAIAGKLGIFLQRFLVQNIYICLFQLALCLCCFTVRLQLVTAIALPHQISAGLHRFLGLVGAFHAHIVLFCFPDLFVELARNQMDGSFLDPLRKFGGWLFLVLKGQLRGLFSGIRVDDRLPDLFLWDIGPAPYLLWPQLSPLYGSAFPVQVRPFLISKAQARFLIQTILPA